MRKWIACLAVMTLATNILSLPAEAKHNSDVNKAQSQTQQAAGKTAWQPELKVGVLQNQSAVNIVVRGKAQVLADGSKKPVLTLAANEKVTIKADGKHLRVNGKKVTASSVTIQAAEAALADEFRFTAGGHDYRGAAVVMLKGSSLTLIDQLRAEDYLYSVVPAEMPSEWPQEAMKAQAVAARTFALQNRGRHDSQGYDLCMSTHCQVYDGTASEKAASSKAVDATRGETLVYNNKLINALFHTDSGGMTENSEDVWGSRLPYLRAATEVHTHTYPWEKTVTAEQMARLVQQSSHKDIGKLKKIELSALHFGKMSNDRSVSGRVKHVIFIGSRGRAEVTGNKLREILGLKSTLFTMSLKNGSVIIKGYGWGHGLGLSQYGAKAWAGQKDYKAILAHYYQGTTLKKLY